MSQQALYLLSVLRAIVEIAMFSLLGQGLLSLMAGERRRDNAIYQLFALLTRPVLKMTRKIAPTQIVDKHIPVLAFFCLLWLWLGLAYIKTI